MNNRKSYRNSYVTNNYEYINAGMNMPKKRYFINSNSNSFLRNPNASIYDQYETEHVLSGGEASGSVWVNPGYDIAKEDPGISWVL